MREDTKRSHALCALTFFVVVYLFPLVVMPTGAWGAPDPSTGATRPLLNKSVQGQEAHQVENTLFNAVNFVGNILAPIGATGLVVAGVVSAVQRNSPLRYFVGAGGLLGVSMLTRLLEYWVSSGAGALEP